MPNQRMLFVSWRRRQTDHLDTQAKEDMASGALESAVGHQPSEKEAEAAAVAAALKSATVHQLVLNKGKLVEVPCTATVGDTLNAMLARNVLAVPVAAPPGQWIGAGGSMILESDKTTGAARKQYIGIVSVLDILIHLSEDENGQDVQNLLMLPVSNIIGHSLEGLSLWTIGPQTLIYDAMEPMSKGIHRALVPIESNLEHVVGVELTESSPGYHMLTQTDVVRFLATHGKQLRQFSTSIENLEAIQRSVYGVPSNMKVTDAVKCMRNASLRAVALIEPMYEPVEELVLGHGKKILGTFSATDLRGCNSSVIRAWSALSVVDFLKKIALAKKFGFGAAMQPVSVEDPTVQIKPPITCLPSTSLEEVMLKAVNNHVHRVWVTSDQGYLVGVVTLSDILRVARNCIKQLCP